LQQLKVYYGGYSGKDDEIDMMTRSMLQIMMELAAVVHVPASDVAKEKATPGLVVDQASGTQAPLALNILSCHVPPRDGFVAMQYQGSWFSRDADVLSLKPVAGNCASRNYPHQLKVGR
jgi:hypothetical protein